MDRDLKLVYLLEGLNRPLRSFERFHWIVITKIAEKIKFTAVNVSLAK
jgi:hypothetical protein